MFKSKLQCIPGTVCISLSLHPKAGATGPLQVYRPLLLLLPPKPTTTPPCIAWSGTSVKSILGYPQHQHESLCVKIPQPLVMRCPEAGRRTTGTWTQRTARACRSVPSLPPHIPACHHTSQLAAARPRSAAEPDSSECCRAPSSRTLPPDIPVALNLDYCLNAPSRSVTSLNSRASEQPTCH